MAEGAKATRRRASHDPAKAAAAPGDMLGDAAVFPSSVPTDAAALATELTAELRQFSRATDENPFSNPILLLALDLSRRLEQGHLSLGALEQLVQHLTVEGYLDRARRFGRYLGETGPEANEARLRAVFAALTQSGENSQTVPFEEFARRVSREDFGIVTTAHPTFSNSASLMRGLAALATGHGEDGQPLTDDGKAALVSRARREEHRPDRDLDLTREHDLSLEAIANIQVALRRANGILLDVARQTYPDRWTELVPRLVTVATWVGYDLDGRSDIRWTDTLVKRLKIVRHQLAHYLETVRSIRGDAGRDARSLREPLDLMESRIALAINQISDELSVFGGAEPSEAEAREQIKAVSRRMYEGMTLRLADAGDLIEMVARAIGRTDDPDLLTRLCTLRAELSNLGLGMAHTHVRINAKQVHNGVRRLVGLVSDPGDPRYRQSYIDRLNELLDAVEPVSINFGSILSERTSVKQLFMVVAQMLKYGGRSAPVRFLIAETESAFTVLTALYFARLFGVDRDVDISPLFETERALEAGSRVVEQLLENPHYRAYVEARGRLCIQTGFSDAGRYLGQTPASASIERLRLRLIRVMAKHKLAGVQLLIFDTHGESIGRGAHPASFEERLNYVDTQATRGYMADCGVDFKQEVSFQGGDGFLYFANQAAAFAVVTRVLEHTLARPVGSADDPFYDEASYIREFFTTVKEFQVGLMDDRNYGVLLMAFGANLLFPSGSRAPKRQHEDPSEIDHAHASQLRAIPHNAVLMQLGLLANSIGGVGAAIAKEPEQFRELYGKSRRLRQLMGIVEYGAAVSDPNVMKGYVDSLDPGFWIIRAGTVEDRGKAEEMFTLASYLEESALHERQMRVFRRLHKDFQILVKSLAGMATEGRPAGCGALVTRETKDAIGLLHAIRLAVIHEIFALAVRIPEFSSRHAATPQQIVTRLLHLDVPAVVELLQEIFPTTHDTIVLQDFGEPANYLPDDSQGYRFENEGLFQPLLGLHELVRRISTATAHRIGFFG
ncbi:MAG: phosphoenolpyruvate carboxylase [Inquilinus sp.]|nr:phosphoenolpyruvate carboxylase [Inquilinus sp.]